MLMMRNRGMVLYRIEFSKNYIYTHKFFINWNTLNQLTINIECSSDYVAYITCMHLYNTRVCVCEVVLIYPKNIMRKNYTHFYLYNKYTKFTGVVVVIGFCVKYMQFLSVHVSCIYSCVFCYVYYGHRIFILLWVSELYLCIVHRGMYDDDDDYIAKIMWNNI